MLRIRRGEIFKNDGFTLIELVIVLAIIATLTALAAFNFNQARARARDISRKNDMKAFVAALEAYKSDNQSYPSSLDDLVTGGYLTEVFIDPKEKVTGGSWADYSYTRDGTDYLIYTLEACLENAADLDKSAGSCGPMSVGAPYQLTNP